MSPLYRFTLRRGFIIKKDPFKLTNLPTYLLAYFLYYLPTTYLLTYLPTYYGTIVSGVGTGPLISFLFS